MRKTLLSLALLACASFSLIAQDQIKADATYLFAERDSISLYLDIYNPSPGSETSIDGITKPTIIYVFGGGFLTGLRDVKFQQKWYRQMNDNGYRVVAIDYRLGLKGADIGGLKIIKSLQNAIFLGVTDLFTATAFLLANADEYGIEPDNIVIAGSSAGAIISLQADYELSKRSEITAILPDGFRYAGVMSFSGALFSTEGTPKYTYGAAPTLFLHGEKDRLVTYKQIWVFNYRWAGASVLSSIFEKNDFNYNILRYKENGHEISIAMSGLLEQEIKFLETNVMKKEHKIIDATIDDPAIESAEWGRMSPAGMFKMDSTDFIPIDF